MGEAEMSGRGRFGSVYRRKKKLPDGRVKTLSIWWIKYRKDGQVFRESSESDNYPDAVDLLKRRVGEIATGKFAGLKPERVRMAELFGDVEEDYQQNGKDTLPDLKGRLRNHLIPFFGEIRARDFSTQYLKRYVSQRREEGAKNATINRELAIIRRAFNLAAKCDPPKVARIPSVQLLKENNVRNGFLEYEHYLTLRNELPGAIRPLFVVAYHVGGRRGELSSIQWSQVDFAAGQIRLHGGDTKNEEGRTLPIYGEMREWLAVAKEIRDQQHPTSPWVFYDDKGARLYWFYEEWQAACKRAGVPGLLFHDLRRSGVRNMERAGIPRKVAMAISGHKTESIYRRYDIVAHRDLRDAAYRMEQYFGALKEDQKGTPAGTPEVEFPDREGSAFGKRASKLLN
jgi:integrase